MFVCANAEVLVYTWCLHLLVCMCSDVHRLRTRACVITHVLACVHLCAGATAAQHMQPGGGFRPEGRRLFLGASAG